MKYFFVLILFSCFPSSAFGLPDRPGSQDLHFADDLADRRALTTCLMNHSYKWHNLVLFSQIFDSNDESHIAISTLDKISQRKNTWYQSPGVAPNHAVKISDHGPSDGTKNGSYINVAIYLDENGASSLPKFSSDSGATFQDLTFHPQAPYETFFDGSFPRNSGRGLSGYFMEFVNDKLYVFYYTKHNTPGIYAYSFNVEVYNETGNSVFYQQLSTWTSDSPLSATKINVVRIENSLVALFSPYKVWLHDFLSNNHIPGILVFDTTTNTVQEEMHIGETSLNPGAFQGFDDLRIHNTNFLASDGRSLFLLNAMEGYVHPEFGSYQPQGQIRMFPPDESGNFLHSNTSWETPLIDLNILPAQIQFSDIFEQTYFHSSKGDVFGFAAPQFRRNFTNSVDLMYRDPDETNQNLWPLKKVRITFSDDGSSVQEVLGSWEVNDIPSGIIGDQMVERYDQLLPPYGSAAHATPGDRTSMVSAPRGTAISWCQSILTGQDGESVYHFVDNS